MKKKSAFSLVELMLSLIIISLIAAAFTPIITKKLKISTISAGENSKITTDCSDKFSSSCKLCNKTYCINCELECGDSTQYLDTDNCKCASCSGDKFGSACKTCDSSGCQECSQGYYLKNGICVICETGKYCDGKNMTSTCPSGYYCDANNMFLCSDKYDINCSECNSSKCTACDNEKYLDGNECKPCGANCDTCKDANYCYTCKIWAVYDSENHNCNLSCSSAIENCYQCSDKNTCTNCNGGYYINTSKTCTKCDKSNCLTCQDNVSADSPVCSECEAGYSLNNGNCESCSERFGSNCILCDSNKCLACKKGYVVKNSTSSEACSKTSSGKFECSDSNFMKIGSLCYTRKNMGDSTVLSIPANTVTNVEVNDEECLSNNTSRCCWHGATSYSCDSNNGSYSGCNRTVCNWHAANAICANYSYNGVSGWRLPTIDEAAVFLSATKNLGSDGLMHCDSVNVDGISLCSQNLGPCLGATNNMCSPQDIWVSYKDSDYFYYYLFQGGSIYGPWPFKNYTALSVRCVKEMND